MTTQTTTLSNLTVKERTMAGVTALAFGLFIIYMTGFAGTSVLHNAAHDTRHSVSFPCH